MRENLDNRDIIVNATDYFLTASNLSNKFGQGSMFINGFDYELGEQINIKNLYGWYMPQLKYSFTNQYVENDRWYFDLDISTRINWGFNNYEGNYDYNKLIWNNINNLAFIVSGTYYGLNNIFVSENNYINSIFPFTIHGSTEETGLYSDSSWPKNLANNKLSYYERNYINNFSIYNYIEQDKYKHNFQDFTNGIPIQEWIGIYNINAWRFINNSNSFEIGLGYAYFGEPLDQFIRNFHYYQSGFVPTSNRNYSIIAYLNNGGSGIIPDQYYTAYTSVDLSNGFGFKKIGNYFRKWVDIYNNKNIYNIGSTFSRYYNSDIVLKPLWQENQYRIRYYLKSYETKSFWDTDNTNNVYLNYGQKFYNPPDEKNIFDGYHFTKWYSPTENNRVIDIENEYFSKDFNHGTTYDLVADYEPNIYTVIYKINADDSNNYAVQSYNHKERIFLPNITPNREAEGLKFNGWRFENGKNLVNAYYSCTKNYTIVAYWDGATFSVNYTYPSANEALTAITDSWNNESHNLIRDKDIYYIKQIAQPSLNFYNGYSWIDMNTNKYYTPGQQVNQSLNLTVANSQGAHVFPLSIFDREITSYISEGGTIIDDTLPFASIYNSEQDGFGWWPPPVATNINSDDNAYFINNIEYCYGELNNKLMSQLGAGFLVGWSNGANYAVDNLANWFLNLNQGATKEEAVLYSIKPLYVQADDWYDFGEHFKPIFPAPFKPGYKFNGWWLNGTQFTDSNGYCIVANYKDCPYRWPQVDEDTVNTAKVFTPEFINLRNNSYYHFPFALTNRNNNIEEVNFYDYSRLYTTKWLNEDTTFNESYHFPSLLIPYKE